MAWKITEEQVRWFRLQRSGLVQPFESSVAVASALVGVQAQILPAAGLALSNRTPFLTEQQYQTLLFTERQLVKLWGQRGTLHLYPSAEWPLIHAALSQRPTWWERTLSQNGGSVEEYRSLIEVVEGMLREQGTIGRSDLRDADLPLDDRHLSAWGGIFADLVRKGYACHAAQEGGEGRFAHREHWLPELEWDLPSADEANVEIARRYLHTYGPATVQDFAYWRGVKVTSARTWFSTLEDELLHVEVQGQEAVALRADLDTLQEPVPEHEGWPVRMLYRFDPLLLAHKDKSWIVAPEHYKRVWRPAGHIEGTLLEYGRAVATWRYDRKSSGLAITVRPFAPLAHPVRAALEGLAGEVARFFELPLQELEVRLEP